MSPFDSAVLHRAVSSANLGSPHRRRRAALAMLAVASIAIAGCGTGSPATSAAEGQTAERIVSVTPAAAATPGSERYESTLERRDGKVRVVPVPDSYRPKISKTEAFESFQRQGVLRETAAHRQADVRLGLYSNNQMNMTLPAVFVDQPAWVIRYDNVPAEANPGPLGIAGAAPVPAGTPVNILVFVDAETGRFLNAVQDPVPVS
jgi:hypothetical protein